jgi:hypothetical protein
VDRRPFAQAHQHVQHRVAVFAARQADHHLVAFLDHVEIADRLTDEAREPLEQLVVLVSLFLLAAREHGLVGPLSSRRGARRFSRRPRASSRRSGSQERSWLNPL